MRLIFARNFLQLSCDRQKVLFSILLLFAVWPTGCSTCFTFVSNPSTGTINISAGDGRPATPDGRMWYQHGASHTASDDTALRVLAGFRSAFVGLDRGRI